MRGREEEEEEKEEGEEARAGFGQLWCASLYDLSTFSCIFSAHSASTR